MDFQRVKKQSREVSMIPLINVIFLLLIFFMVAGTVESIDTFEVNPPESENGREKQPHVPAVIYLNSDGRVAVNNDIIAHKDLKTIISTLFIDDPKQKVTIKSDAGVDARKLVEVMNMVETAGGEEVLLVTQAGDR